jgi:hypothetical protein
LNYNFSQIRKNVFLVQADSQYALTSMFMRPQEFYESPFEEIRGKYFTLEQYMDRYAKENRKFTYFEDWSGFNIPSEYFSKFFNTFQHKDLTVKEITLKDNINTLRNNWDDTFYVIGIIKGQEKVLKHEIAHAYWYLDFNYAAHMVDLIKETISDKLYNTASESLIKKGYSLLFVNDEIHAYMATASREGILEIFSWDNKTRVSKNIQKFFKEYDLAHK